MWKCDLCKSMEDPLLFASAWNRGHQSGLKEKVISMGHNVRLLARLSVGTVLRLR